MSDSVLDAIVVGAGYAGLSTSHFLKNYGLRHIVFERCKVGESWQSQRWDSFKMNTSNKLNALPDQAFNGQDPDAFCTALEYASSLEDYVSTFKLPVLENSRVVSIERSGEFFEVVVLSQGTHRNYFCRQAIIASGIANEISIPSIAQNVPKDIVQLHAGQYKNPGQLPPGSLLVVGSAQSGCQIAEELADAGRKVYLSTSMVARVPRRYRGRDVMDWLIDMNFFEARGEEIDDPNILHMKAPQLTGTEGGTKTISLQSLAKKKVTVLGKTDRVAGDTIFFHPNAALHVQFADEFSVKVKEMIDQFIATNQLPAEPPRVDENDIPNEAPGCASAITTLNFLENNIRSVIWSTGFSADFSYIKLPVFDDAGDLRQKDGIPSCRGIYFVGFPWLRFRKSSILFGIKEDARFVARKVFEGAVVPIGVEACN